MGLEIEKPIRRVWSVLKKETPPWDRKGVRRLQSLEREFAFHLEDEAEKRAAEQERQEWIANWKKRKRKATEEREADHREAAVFAVSN